MRTSLSALAGIAAAALLTVSGCAGLWPETAEQQQQQASLAVQNKITEAQKLVKDAKYPEAISTYRLVLQEHPNAAWAAEAKYGIALAYVSADNPQRDYAAAVAEFDEFLSLYPADKRVAEAKSWRQALKVLLETRRDNDRLNKNMEKLKQLDVKQEEKRLGR